MPARGRDRDPRAAAVWRLAFVVCLVAFPAEARADYAAGAVAYERGNYAVAFTEWSAAAAAGDAHAEQGLGTLYETGQGVPARDFPQAVQWYRAAAAQGLPAGQNNLARLYADGRGVPRNPVMATELWHSAAAAGYPLAQFNLALAYEQGFGIARDYLAAARWYSEAGNRGIADAAFALSELYRTGRGVPQHDQLARLWHDVAVKLGSKLALQTDFEPALPAVPPAAAASPPPAPKPHPTHARVAATPTAAPPKAAPAPAPPTAAAPKQATPPATPTATAPMEAAVPAEQIIAVPTAAPPPAPAIPTGAGFSVQLASSPSPAAAASLRDRLAGSLRGQLDGIDLYVQRADLGADKGVWYRVLAGKFERRAAAADLCARLKSAGSATGCLVVAAAP
jgi:hypothetical protein